MTRRTVGRRKRANKRFKRDIQRAAFLLCVGLCDYGAMRKVSSSVGCPLSGRYATRRSTWRKGNGFKRNITICSRLSGY